MKPLAYTKTQTLKPGSIFVKYVARLPLVTDASGKSPNSPPGKAQQTHSEPTANGSIHRNVAMDRSIYPKWLRHAADLVLLNFGTGHGHLS